MFAKDAQDAACRCGCLVVILNDLKRINRRWRGAFTSGADGGVPRGHYRKSNLLPQGMILIHFRSAIVRNLIYTFKIPNDFI